MANPLPALVLGGVLGLGLLAAEGDWDRRASDLAFEREMAWGQTAEGRDHWDCLTRPLMASMGIKGPMCSAYERAYLDEARARARRVGAFEVAATYLP